MRTLFIELRRSPARWWLPLLIAMDLLMLFGRSRDWIGIWPQASAAAQVPAFYLAPALAAVAAWSANRSSRNRMLEQFAAAALPRWKRELLCFAPVMIYGLLAYAVGIAAAAAVSFADAGPGFMWANYLLLGACLLVAGAAVGHLAGRWMHSTVWPPVVSVLIVLGLMRVQLDEEDLFYVLSGRPQLEFSQLALAARVLLSVALAALAVVAPSRKDLADATPGARYRGIGATAGFLACVVFCALWTLTTGPLRVERPAVTPLCTATAPRVCLWPEERKYLPAAERMARNTAALPASLFQIPDAYYERGLAGRESSIDLQFGPYGIAGGISSTTLNATLPTPCAPKTRADSDRKFKAVFELDAWLTRRVFGADQPAAIQGGPGIDVNVVKAALAQSEEQQAEWVRQRLRIIKETPCA